MRPYVALLLIACLPVSTKVHAQKKITLTLEHVRLKEAFHEIEQQAPCHFSFESKDTGFNNISLHRHKVGLKEAVRLCLLDFPLKADYSRPDASGKIHIVIYRDSAAVLNGRVINENGEAEEGASVGVIKTTNIVRTDEKGRFSLTGVPDTAELLISGMNIVQTHCRTEGRIRMVIQVKTDPHNLAKVTVTPTYNTGYEKVRKDRSPGSFYVVNLHSLGLGSSTDILHRLIGQTSGLLYGPGTGNPLNITIRSRNTISAGTQPLIVLDGFAFDGDMNTINPNDIESVTVLKDPVAASIWGARSGNGVIVITTKRGMYNKRPRVSLNISTTVTGKPDLFYKPQMSSAAYAGMEKFLFSKNYYDAVLSDPSHPSVSPVVELLYGISNHTVSPADGDAELSNLADHDTRTDLLKYFYRTSVSQQYYLGISGGGTAQQYYFSFGYDHDPTFLMRNGYGRMTVYAANTYQLIPKKLEISTIMRFTQSNTLNNNSGMSPVAYPYLFIADRQGHPLAANYKYRNGYIDTAGAGQLLDWRYFPLNELSLADNTTRLTDGNFQAAVKYNVFNGLSLDLTYRYTTGRSVNRNLNSGDGFYARDLTNQFSQINGSVAVRPVPVGDILIVSNTGYTSQNLRAMLSYISSGDSCHQLGFMTGAEFSDLGTNSESYRAYGYDKQSGTSIPVDPVHQHPNYITGNPEQIPWEQGSMVPQGISTRYVSVFGNLTYSLDSQYSFYGSLRKDATNIVGIEANQKWVPFYSLGTGWTISKNSSYDVAWLPLLKFRIGFGNSGNVGNKTAYLVTQSLGNNGYGVPQSGIVNPPDPGLKWEKTRMINMGVDFSLFRDSISRQGRIYGSLEGYFKKGTDILGSDTLPASSGLTAFVGNTAGMKGRGMDLVLNTENTRGVVKWNTTILFSYAADWVTDYHFIPPSIAGYVQGANPMAGKPVASLFSYRWAGLDPKNGDPQGYLNKKTSSDYNTLMNGSRDGMVYSGSYQPIFFGSLLNTFSWKRWALSFLITCKLGYFFRRPSINYYRLITGVETGHKDFDKRWQSPGDENKTQVPSFPILNDPNRDDFYQYSSVLVTKADHIRCQNLHLSYDILQNFGKTSSFRSIEAYLNIDQLGILWKANGSGIDPDAANYGDIPAPRAYSIGIKATL